MKKGLIVALLLLSFGFIGCKAEFTYKSPGCSFEVVVKQDPFAPEVVK